MKSHYSDIYYFTIPVATSIVDDSFTVIPWKLCHHTNITSHYHTNIIKGKVWLSVFVTSSCLNGSTNLFKILYGVSSHPR